MSDRAALRSTEKNTSMLAIRHIMLALNIVMVLFIVLLIYYVTNSLCSGYSARAFLDRVGAIPWQPVDNVLLCVLLLCVICLSYAFREYIFPGKAMVEYGTLIIDVISGVALVLVLGFNYNGILLWVFANLVLRAKDVKWQYILMLFAVVCFLLTNYNILSTNFKIYSVLDYIYTFEVGAQTPLLMIYNGMTSANMILFITYCVFMIQMQRGTIEEVNMLYSQLERANEELESANVQLQDYAIMREKVGETNERNRLAREIHDSIGHTLTSISAGIDACVTTVESSPEQTKDQLIRVSEVTRQGINDIRRSVRKLRPDTLQRYGLEVAIRMMIADTGRAADTNIFLSVDLSSKAMSEDEENAAYRIVQESITNALRHGKAGNIWVKLEIVGDKLHLTVQDDGCGCAEIHNGFGTEQMMERVRSLNGTISFNGSGGFCVDAVIPIRERQ